MSKKSNLFQVGRFVPEQLVFRTRCGEAPTSSATAAPASVPRIKQTPSSRTGAPSGTGTGLGLGRCYDNQEKSFNKVQIAHPKLDSSQTEPGMSVYPDLGNSKPTNPGHPFQVRGTIFNDLDDDKLHSIIDFSDFEERFKIGINSPLQNGNTEIDGLNNYPSKRFKKPENITLLEHTRLRNIGKLIIHRMSYFR